MAQFEIAYRKFVEPWEGGYANISGDKGGETYSGITRINFPYLPLWNFIDNVKMKRTIRTNEKFPELNNQVLDFYRSYWSKQKFSDIKSQDIANIIFDFYVNSGATAIKTVQRIIGVSTDGALGNNTVAAINKLNPSTLHDKIKNARIQFYENIVARDPTQSKFLIGWMRRINSFPTLTKIAGGTIILIISVFFIYLLIK